MPLFFEAARAQRVVREDGWVSDFGSRTNARPPRALPTASDSKRQLLGL